MNFITCRKCGTKLTTSFLRCQDLSDYREELEKKKINLLHNPKAVKKINLELIVVNRQLKIAKKIEHIQLHDTRNEFLIHHLKEIVTKEQFDKAVIKANEDIKTRDELLKQEYQKYYGVEKELKELNPTRNSEHYMDLTAYRATM